MLISDLLGSIRGDVMALGELGGSESVAQAKRLGAALEPALRARFLEALNELVQEFNLQETVPLTINLEGDRIRLVRLLADGEVVAAPMGDLSARIALRLSDELKGNIEHLATDVGSSVNSWIVRNLERSVRGDAPSSTIRGSRHLRGTGRA